MAKRIALVTCEAQATEHDGEDAQLQAWLQGKGLEVNREVWSNPQTDWKSYHLVVLKSTWDYHEQAAAFHGWLRSLQAAGVAVQNPADTVIWNSNKKYLPEIADSGLPVIPTALLPQGSLPGLETFFNRWNTAQIVIKPSISAGARNTLLLRREEAVAEEDKLYIMLQAEDYLVQPYLPEVEQGEWSFLFFGGRFSHSLLKVPKAGDFRVQHIHGGTYAPAGAGAVFEEKAAVYVQQFAKDTLYARVDGIIRNNEFYLMELELIEPYLFLSTTPDGFDNYYKALASKL
ncbi:ATP-grasp domain-containing protein [Chitinophaga alhagiae]|uniref:ATP-grasp domain-containing protein n=1 Tax=Chitinophaga alhagiae TaxID=2203219 RepID=UPI0013007652|nr:hypothetical protein [Chitinophaga alhagiae]